jgi:protein lysine acetyltransferase
MVTKLHDGTLIRIRPIRPSDKHALAAGLARLSDETIRRRFLTSKPQFSKAELRYLTEVDGDHHVALVGELLDAPG